MNGPSKHLSWRELACNDGAPYPREFIEDGRIFKLAQSFEDVRSLCGNKQITIFSAYRTPSWNSNPKVKGAKYSQHLYGRALDMKTPKGFTTRQFYDLIHANTKDFGINGLGLYKTFVHIDIRPTNRLFVWSSTLPKESRTW